LAPPQPPRYDFARIAQTLSRLEQQEAAWLRWFAAQGFEPLPLTYEELATDPARTLLRVCRFLELPAPSEERPRPSVAKLADALSADWMRRFREERGKSAPA
jgi:LPS sulfotransferase NodH